MKQQVLIVPIWVTKAETAGQKSITVTDIKLTCPNHGSVIKIVFSTTASLLTGMYWTQHNQNLEQVARLKIIQK